MIIGNGDIAQALKDVKDNPDIIFFASGVSNSKCTDKSQFAREQNLLREQDRTKRLIYFSTLSIYYSTGEYATHKFSMEELVRELFPAHSIVRIGNITWGDNPHTLINHLRHCIHNNKPYKIENANRFIISREQFISAMNFISESKIFEVDLRGERVSVSEIERRIKAGEL